MSESPRLGARQRPAQQAARRESLLDSLIALFLEDGFRGLSVDDMAAWAHCSKRTIYTLGESKEQVVLTVVRAFFRRATEWIERNLDRGADPTRQIGSYLLLISQALAPASPQFFADLDEFAPAREIYDQNTRAAAAQVQQLVRGAAEPMSRKDAEFIGTVAGIVMNAIHRKEVAEATGMDDADAYRALARLIVAGVRGSRPATS
ncbi:TetR/AcrR family transcriptional regulator [Microbacterium sp.]|uniref:TetR/AcrR family transcriptional regulator n=1 Tax=Microbacterium sp. TaxID=51671 RepID=UPI0037CA834F